MSEDLTPRQQILLWDLVSRGGGALQKDLRPKVGPADREPLREARYIEVTVKKDRSILLTIEEPGWNYLASQAPSLLKTGEGSKYDRPILQFVLARIQGYAHQHDAPFAAIFAGRLGPSISRAPETDDRIETVGRRDNASSTEEAIRAAFFEMAGRPARDGVRLSALRARLAHVDRAALDATLLAMRKAGVANLMNLDNPRDIEAEADSAIHSGPQTFHVVWIHE